MIEEAFQGMFWRAVAFASFIIKEVSRKSEVSQRLKRFRSRPQHGSFEEIKIIGKDGSAHPLDKALSHRPILTEDVALFFVAR